jgi:hypothetical protein
MPRIFQPASRLFKKPPVVWRERGNQLLFQMTEQQVENGTFGGAFETRCAWSAGLIRFAPS